MLYRIKNILYQLYRVIPDLLFLSVLFFISYKVLDRQDAYGLFNSFISVALRISCGIIHAHISRKFIMHGVSLHRAFKDNDKGQIIFFAVWYGVIIWAWARGG